MTVNVTIAGRSVEILDGSLTINQAMTYQMDTARFVCKSMTKPMEKAEVIISGDNGIEFAGLIAKSELYDDEVLLWTIQCNDYSDRLNAKEVVEEYSGVSASEIAKDVMTKYVPSEFSMELEEDTPVIEFIQFNRLRFTEVMKKLCDYVGLQWYVDYDKTIKFFNPKKLMVSAPIQFSKENGLQYSNLKFAVDVQNLRNRVSVIGGQMLSDLKSYPFRYDGVSIAWDLKHRPYGFKMYVGGVEKTVGIENVDDETLFDFVLNAEKQRITAGGTFVAPAEGTTFEPNYQYGIDVITVAENAASQLAISVIQGGDGVYEHTITDTTIITLEAAEALGQKDIREYADPNIQGSAETRISGWVPGQILNINRPDLGIENQYMVQSVNVTFEDGEWVYSPTFGGRLITLADFLQTLVSNQQNVDVKTSILQKYVYIDETIVVEDEWLFETRINEWVLEDSVEVTINNSNKSFQTVGSNLIAVTLFACSGLKYRENGGEWVVMVSGRAYTVNHPCVLEVASVNRAYIRNWKVPYEETDAICGEVVAIN